MYFAILIATLAVGWDPLTQIQVMTAPGEGHTSPLDRQTYAKSHALSQSPRPTQYEIADGLRAIIAMRSDNPEIQFLADAQIALNYAYSWQSPDPVAMADVEAQFDHLFQTYNVYEPFSIDARMALVDAYQREGSFESNVRAVQHYWIASALIGELAKHETRYRASEAAIHGDRHHIQRRLPFAAAAVTAWAAVNATPGTSLAGSGAPVAASVASLCGPVQIPPYKQVRPHYFARQNQVSAAVFCGNAQPGALHRTWDRLIASVVGN